jgi:hypothetical protein
VVLLPCSEGGRWRPWGGARLSDDGGAYCVSTWGGRRPSGLVGCGLIGAEAEKNSFQNKNWIFEFTKALEICTRIFRRNFDTRIFPKFF